MKPSLDGILAGSGIRLVTEVVPRLAPDYLSGSTNTIGGMLFAGAVEYDRAAEVRVAENEALAALLLAGAGQLPAGGVRAQAEASAAERAASLRVSDLDLLNTRLRAALIALQVEIEALDAAWARAWERDVWARLASVAALRRVDFPR
jgi:hypothetical protein